MYLAVGNSSRTYGPLLVIIALLLWAELTSLAVHLGLATASEVSREMGRPETVELHGSEAVRSAAR